MIRLSKLTDYATVILSFMAQDWHVLRTAMEISDITGIALPTVSKIMKVLVNSGLLSSIRGVKGGYRLVREPEKISVASIISALEGPIAITECSISEHHCEQSDGCRIRANWGLINLTINNALAAVTLADLVAPVAPLKEINVPVASLYR